MRCLIVSLFSSIAAAAWAGAGSRVEGNNCVDNDSGIQAVVSGDNFIVGNTCHGNTTNFDVSAGNALGTVVDVTAGGAVTSTIPWANFEY
jgi:parallel beta-helix repeat protein